MKFTIGAAVLALASGASAFAAEITYIATGTGSATVAGNPFSGAFTITGVGDTDLFFNPPATPTVNAVILNSLTIRFGSNVFTTVLPSIFFTNPPPNFNGFNTFDPATNMITQLLGFKFVQPSPYDALSDFGPVAIFGGLSQTAVGPVGPSFNRFHLTDAGLFQWTNFQVPVSTFQAELTTLAAVPEPASWALMIAGFGIAGAAMRRKAKVSTKVSYS